jgi:hypothetical protein
MSVKKLNLITAIIVGFCALLPSSFAMAQETNYNQMYQEMWDQQQRQERDWQFAQQQQQEAMQAQQAANTPPPPPRPITIWERRWGGLAYDSTSAQWFGAYSYQSQRAVRAGLIDYCEKQGAPECKIQLTYSNQCAAVARAYDKGVGQPRKDSVNTGANENEAKENAIRSCKSDWGTNQCDVIISGCGTNSSRTIYR